MTTKKCVNGGIPCGFVITFYTSTPVSSAVARLWRECKVQLVGLMEKLIRGQSSHPNLLTHFRPSHYVPLHLPLSVSHSPTAVNELMLSHTLCLQLYLFLLRSVRRGRTETWLFATATSPIRYLHFPPSVSPSSLRPRAFSVCERQIANGLYPHRGKVVTGAQSH